ncbi:hypothetical protein [Sporomusa malonica]|uniref:Uncharacterized protein n=1 Tax=Sporomusa malonica TaxID=112901 RepID=A0A1W1YG46_9FIRM|nr:hypothetical protein [Sporomusa malonica]SMC35106.1 hypothetical protein SAMN04488500_101331 [Sporomusa malonica]
MPNNMTRELNKTEWEISVPIFCNPIILRQLAIAIGLPFGFLVVLLISSSKNPFTADSLYALGLIGALLLLTYIFIMTVYGGNYAAAFVIDDKGIRCYTQKKQAKTNRIINGLTVILGLLSRNPAAAGAGLLAQSRQSVFLKWSSIQKVDYQPKRHIIMVRGNVAESIAVFCTQDNYGEVAALICQQARTKNSGMEGST